MGWLIRALGKGLGGAVLTGLGFVVGADLYETIKKRIAGRAGDSTPQRDTGDVVSKVTRPGSASRQAD